MSINTLGTAIDSMSDLLDEERAALLCGNLDRVARLHRSKEHLIEDLNGHDPKDDSQFAELTAKLKRNQSLLDGALDGIRLVTARLTLIQSVRQSLETYDADGRRTSVEMTLSRSVERRA